MKTRMLCIILILVLTVLVIVGSCAWTKFVQEPGGASPTLLIGQIMIYVTKCPQPASLDGTHKKDITIQLEDQLTAKIIELKSKGIDGYFSIINPENYHYKIVGFRLHEKTDRGTRELAFSFNGNIIIDSGKVNNVGIIECDVNFKSTKVDIRVNQKYEDIKIWFAEKYPESAWNKKEWVNVGIF